MKRVGSSVGLGRALVGRRVSVSSCQVLDLGLATDYASAGASDVPGRPLSLNSAEVSGSRHRGLVRIFFGPTRPYSAPTGHAEHMTVADAIHLGIYQTF